MIYLDHNATSPIDPQIAAEVSRVGRAYPGNPSSLHAEGRRARALLDACRRRFSQALAMPSGLITFTRGATEANHLAVVGSALARADRGRHVVTTAVEHPSVLGACDLLRSLGFEVTIVPVDGSGRVDPTDLLAVTRPDTTLVSVILAQNEVGTVQPVREIAHLLRQKGYEAWLHSDAVQAVGRLHLVREAQGADLLSLGFHKVHGPPGVGALWTSSPAIRPQPLLRGGRQEGGLRPGTEDLAAIAGATLAFENATAHLEARASHMHRVSTRLLRGVLESADATLNGPPWGSARLPNTLNICFRSMEAEPLLINLDLRGICVGVGSACSSGAMEVSHVLMAMGLTRRQAASSLRFSVSHTTTIEEIDRTVAALQDIMRASRER